MALKVATNVRYNSAGRFLETVFDLADVDDGDTVSVPGLSRVDHASVHVTGATEDVVQVASTAGNVITFEGGTNTPVTVEAKGFR